MRKEYIYPGAIQSLEKIIAGLNINNILLVRGNQSYIKSGAKETLSPIFEKYNVVEFAEFSVNPKLEEAKMGFELFKKNNIDVIIAIGGGSVIDTAKIIKYLAIQKNSINTNIPFIVAPTTAGTGSEATHFAVVYIDGVKHSWTHESLIPTVAIVDANLLQGQSKYQIAVSGIDALAQGIESFWSVNSTEKSLVYSEKAIKLMWENLENAVNGNKEALIRITEGSNWAGKAINIAKTTAPHALSYGFTKHAGLAHGHAVAISLPIFMKLHREITEDKCNDSRGVKHINKVIERIAEIMNCQIEDLERTFVDFLNDINIISNYKQLNISDETIKKISLNINEERLGNNPLKVDVSTLPNLYK